MSIGNTTETLIRKRRVAHVGDRLLLIYGIGNGIAWLSFIVAQWSWPELSNSLLPDRISMAERISGYAALAWLVMGVVFIIYRPPRRRNLLIFLIFAANALAIYFPLSDLYKYSS